MASKNEVTEKRRGAPWLQALVLAALPLLITCHPFMYYSSSDSRRSYSRNIRPLACGTKQGDTGVCMFAWDCMKANGTHLGTCIDRFYFGSCCKLKPGTAKPVHTPMKTDFTIHATTRAPESQTVPIDSDSANEIDVSLQPVESSSQPSDSNLLQLVSGEATIKPDSGSLLPEMVESSTSFPVTGDQAETFAAVETPTEQEIDQTLVSEALPMQEIEQQMQHELGGQNQNTQGDGEQEDDKNDLVSDSHLIDQQVDVSVIPVELDMMDGQEEQQEQDNDDIESTTHANQQADIVEEMLDQSNNGQATDFESNFIDEFVNEMIQSANEEIDSGSKLPSTELPDVVSSTDDVQQTGSLDYGTVQTIVGDDEKLTSSIEQDTTVIEEQTTDQPTTNEQPDQSAQEGEDNVDVQATTDISIDDELSGAAVEENEIETGEVQQEVDSEKIDEQAPENEQENEQIAQGNTELVTEQTPDSIENVQSEDIDEETTEIDSQTTEDYPIEISTLDTQDTETSTNMAEVSMTGEELDGDEAVNQSLETSDQQEDPNVNNDMIDVTTDQTLTTAEVDSTDAGTIDDDDESAATESQTLAETTEVPDQESSNPDIGEQTDSSVSPDGDNIENNTDDGQQEDSVQSATAQSVTEGYDEDDAVTEQQTEEIDGDKEDDNQLQDEELEAAVTETSDVTVSHSNEIEQTQEVEQGQQENMVDQEYAVVEEHNETQNEVDYTVQESPSGVTPDSASQVVEDSTTPADSSTTDDDSSDSGSTSSEMNTTTEDSNQGQGDVTEKPDDKDSNLQDEVTPENESTTVDSSIEVSDATTPGSILTDGGSEEQGQSVTTSPPEDSFIVPGVQIIAETDEEVDESIPDELDISTTESDVGDKTQGIELPSQNDMVDSEQTEDDINQTEQTEDDDVNQTEQSDSTTPSLPTAAIDQEIQSSTETTSPSNQVQTTEESTSEQVNATGDASIEITRPDATGQVVIGIDAPLKNKTETSSESDDDKVFETQEDQILHRLNSSSFRDICGQPVYPSKRIVGGSQANFGEWPWQVSLRQWRSVTYLHKCGAALVNENWAITAAHCVENAQPDQILLRLGEYDLERVDEPYGHLERKVQIIATHPQFDPRTFEYDLALLRFSEPVTFQPNIIPICIPSDDYDFIGDTGFVSGWGRLYEAGPLHSRLQMVAVPVLGNEECSQMFFRSRTVVKVPEIMMCAGYSEGKKDACEGDSGGPLVIQHKNSWMLAGVISWGIGCALPNQPGVYTRISAFRDWINKIIVF